MTDQELNNRLQKGDKNALKILFDRYYDDLFRYGMKLILNRETAEEIVQDIFISLWEKHKERDISSFRHYLFKAVKNRSINYIKRNVPSFNQIEDERIFNESYEVTPHEQMANRELAELVENALGKLPKRCALVFSLSRNSDMSYKEIAEELDISVRTVENQIGIALKKLREMLNNYWK